MTSNGSGEWPPPRVKEEVLAVLGKDADDALWPSWREIDEKTRQLGHMLVDAANPSNVKEACPIMAISSRGGMHIGNILSRALRYTNSEIRFLGISSYEEATTHQTGGFIYGQMPLKQDIEGKRVLHLDEVCHTGMSQMESERLLKEDLGAKDVVKAVLDFKEEQTTAAGGLPPDFFVAKTEKWIVYPWEVYEHLGELALNRKIWEEA